MDVRKLDNGNNGFIFLYDNTTSLHVMAANQKRIYIISPLNILSLGSKNVTANDNTLNIVVNWRSHVITMTLKLDQF